MQIGNFGNFNFGIRALGQNQDQIAESLERLATGKKVNRASDDPSGIIAIEKHKARIYSIEGQLRSFAQQESYLGAKEGGLSVIADKVIELNELTVRAANKAGNSQEEQDAIELEINSVLESINHIAQTTTFKGRSVLSEYSSGSIADGLESLATLAFEDPEAAQALAQESVDKIAKTRGAIGNQLNEIESQRSVLSDELINLTGSLSSIEDVDFAAESAKLVRAQILEQASILAIDVNRQSAQQVLGLIKDATQIANTNI
jgi:flagellin